MQCGCKIQYWSCTTESDFIGRLHHALSNGYNSVWHLDIKAEFFCVLFARDQVIWNVSNDMSRYASCPFCNRSIVKSTVTLWHVNYFRITDTLWGEYTDHRWFSSHKFSLFFSIDKLLNKQSSSSYRWPETPWRSYKLTGTQCTNRKVL